MSMSVDEFIRLAHEKVKPGTVWHGPGKGVRKVVELQSDGVLSYFQGQKEKSRIYLSLTEAWQITQRYRGQRLTSRDLRTARPDIFQPGVGNGHDCNRTTLFHVLKEIGLVRDIEGPTRGPFYVKLPNTLCVVR